MATIRRPHTQAGGSCAKGVPPKSWVIFRWRTLPPAVASSGVRRRRGPGGPPLHHRAEARRAQHVDDARSQKVF
mgnify:CR=1 FL=1